MCVCVCVCVCVCFVQVSAGAWVSMVVSAVLGLLALTVVFSTIYLMRSWSLWLSGTVSEDSYHIMQCHVLHAGARLV